ncbi:MAG: hypothetical protein ABEJ83_02425 [Candidatus Nanohaloarchaea archaeon]
MDLVKNSLIRAALATVLILAFGLLIGMQMDDLRTGYVDEKISETSLNTQTLMAVQDYFESSENYCKLVREEIPEMAERNAEIGVGLQEFSSKGVSEGEKYKQLRRRYYVSQLRLYNTITGFQKRCRSNMSTVLFFFDGDISSDRQGAVLTEYRREVDNKTSIFSFNLDVDQSKVLDILVTDYNVTEGPTIVINGNKTYRKYVPLTQLENIMDSKSYSTNKTNTENNEQ